MTVQSARSRTLWLRLLGRIYTHGKGVTTRELCEHTTIAPLLHAHSDVRSILRRLEIRRFVTSRPDEWNVNKHQWFITRDGFEYLRKHHTD